MKAFEYAVAKNEDGVRQAVARGYKIKASGIDVLDMMKERIEKADKLVSILQVESLKGIREENDGLTIGALSTLAEIGRHAGIRANYGALAEAAGDAATPQVREVATLGGNLCQRPRCWYFRGFEHHCLKKGGSTCFAVEGENQYHAIIGGGPCHIVHPSNTAPALVALDAVVVVRNDDGEREIPAGEFFVLPSKSMYAENVLEDGDLITAVRLSKKPSKVGYCELREKQSFDWPMASCAAARHEDGWRVVMGFVAPIPWRSEKAEKMLNGAESIDDSVAQQAADAALSEAQPMSENGWRVQVARAAVRRAILRAEGKEEV